MASRFLTSAPCSVALAAMFAAISPAVAFATDLPLPPMVTKAPPLPAAVAPYNWSGLYVGGHLGYLWGRTRVEEGGAVTERNARTDGIIGGAMIGYNWQIGRAVFGLEGDFGWTNARGVGTGPEPPSPILSHHLHLRRLHRHLRRRLLPPPALIPVTTHGPNHYDVAVGQSPSRPPGLRHRQLVPFRRRRASPCPI